MNIDTKTLEEAVVKQAVEELVNTYTSSDSEVAAEISSKASTLVAERVNKALSDELLKFVDAGLETMTFQRTNSHGEKKSEPESLREYITRRIDETLNEFVDSNGNPTKDAWYTKDPNNKRIHKILKAHIGDKIQAEVQAACNTALAAVNIQIAGFVKAALDEATTRLKR